MKKKQIAFRFFMLMPLVFSLILAVSIINRYDYKTKSLGPKVPGAPTLDPNKFVMLPPPKITSHFTAKNPASLKPVLRWTKVQGAPVYEIEVFADNEKIYENPYIFVNGYNLVLPEDLKAKKISWHVRALNLDRLPMSEYSAMEESYIDPKVPAIKYPVPMVDYNTGNGTAMLYPVYSWIPMAGASHYEVEILSQPPENPLGRRPSQYRIGQGLSDTSELYDDMPRMSTKPFYWRVRALSDSDEIVGTFSPAKPIITNPDKPYTIGTLGDSITHGGGGVSYNPGDWEYDYQYYLKFDTINLGLSGDTSESMADRFDDDVLPFHLQYLIIMGGSNSLREGVDPDDVIENLETIKVKCLNNDIVPVFLTLPAINPTNIYKTFQEETVDDWQKSFAKVNAYIRTQRHIDLATKLPEKGILPTYYALDGLHLDVEGKKLMGEAINEQWDETIKE
jgi:lysophospholipase L1-like esterase